MAERKHTKSFDQFVAEDYQQIDEATGGADLDIIQIAQRLGFKKLDDREAQGYQGADGDVAEMEILLGRRGGPKSSVSIIVGRNENGNMAAIDFTGSDDADISMASFNSPELNGTDAKAESFLKKLIAYVKGTHEVPVLVNVVKSGDAKKQLSSEVSIVENASSSQSAFYQLVIEMKAQEGYGSKMAEARKTYEMMCEEVMEMMEGEVHEKFMESYKKCTSEMKAMEGMCNEMKAHGGKKKGAEDK